jgi:hypothetical protein
MSSTCCRILALTALAAGVLGCSGMPNRREPISSTHIPPGFAVILVSVASEDASCHIAASDLAIRDVDTAKIVKTLFVQNPFVKSDFPDHLGHVYAFSLPPGEYAFWLLQSNQFFRYADGHVDRSFRVASGDLTYLGDFLVRGCGGIQTMFYDNWPNVKGKFTEVYPALDLERVTKSIIQSDRVNTTP